VLGKYVKGKGEQVNSDTLVASGKDALLDSVISASTLVAALIFIFSGVALEAWLGAIIAAIIIKAGVDILREAISKILGERIDADITLAVKETIRSFPEVHGAYDLVLNDYGPERLRGSVHVEIDEALNATQIAELTRKIQSKVFLEHNVVLTAVGIYSTNVASETAAAMRADIERLVYAHEDVLEMHGFYVNEDTKEGNFDIIVSFDRADREDIYAEICDEVKQHYPEYRFTIFLDADVTD
jgi:divalent metal cation (Fe/Co/Zn/Cd) transporter